MLFCYFQYCNKKSAKYYLFYGKVVLRVCVGVKSVSLFLSILWGLRPAKLLNSKPKSNAIKNLNQISKPKSNAINNLISHLRNGNIRQHFIDLDIYAAIRADDSLFHRVRVQDANFQIAD